MSKKIKIRFVGKSQRIVNGSLRLVTSEAPETRINGGRRIELPPAERQKKGFTHPDAAFLLAQYPKEFKKIVSKGKK